MGEAFFSRITWELHRCFGAKEGETWFPPNPPAHPSAQGTWVDLAVFAVCHRQFENHCSFFMKPCSACEQLFPSFLTGLAGL